MHTSTTSPRRPSSLAQANRIADICERHGVTLPAAAIAYVLRHPAVVTVVLGARGRAQVRSNVERRADTHTRTRLARSRRRRTHPGGTRMTTITAVTAARRPLPDVAAAWTARTR